MELSFNSKKALCVQIGEDAGQEIMELLEALVVRVEQLERTKVDVMPVVPTAVSPQTVPLRKAA